MESLCIVVIIIVCGLNSLVNFSFDSEVVSSEISLVSHVKKRSLWTQNNSVYNIKTVNILTSLFSFLASDITLFHTISNKYQQYIKNYGMNIYTIYRVVTDDRNRAR